MKVMIAAVVVVIIVLLGLYIRHWSNSGNGHYAAPPLPTDSSTFNPNPTLTTPSGTTSSSPSGSIVPSGGVTKFTFPNGLSFTAGDSSLFKAQPQHIVTLRVFSQGNVQLIRIGWLAPQSYDAPYGDIHNVASPWTLTLHSSGDKYHAALFIGTDATGNPVTCQILVDGVVKQTLRAEHDFARQTCVG